MPDRALWFVVPGDLHTRTGGYGYDREIIDGLRARGWQVTVCELPGRYPDPTADDRAAAALALSRIPDEALVMIDGLAFGVLPAEAAAESRRLRLIALVHHPLALETGLDPAQAARLDEQEERALSSALGVVVTSRRTVAAVEELGVRQELIAVVEPGTHPAIAAAGSIAGAIRLLCVASVVPRKGHDTLFDALRELEDLDWRLACVGGLDRDSMWAQAMIRRCDVQPLHGRVEFVGELEGDALESAYHEADLFVLPTRYEGFGMVIAEAVAHGLPVVSTPTGAIADLIPPEAGILVPPDDPATLARVLRRVLDRDALARLKTGALRARQTLHTWTEACARMEAALVRLSARPAAAAPAASSGSTSS